jgi:hypothetical protein
MIMTMMVQIIRRDVIMERTLPISSHSGTHVLGGQVRDAHRLHLHAANVHTRPEHNRISDNLPRIRNK